MLLLAACSQRPQAELLLSNGRIHTLDAQQPWAEAIAIDDGRIVAVGSAEEVAGWAGDATERIDLRGRLVLPAFHDAHVHPIMAGLRMAECDLSGAATVVEIRARIAEWVGANPDAPWLVGGGWELPIFPDANPHKALLDSLISDRPAILRAADGHSAWVNSAALQAAGIEATTPDPPRGRIERDIRSGEPSGTLREAASQLVSRLQPPISDADRATALRRALHELNRLGIVSFLDASADSTLLATYLRADREGWLSARVRVALRVDPAQDERQVARLTALRDRGTPRVQPNVAKFFVDGVLESQTAALLEPYVGEVPLNAEPNFAPQRLNALVTFFDAAGFQVHLHAIGDRAIRMGLDAIELAREQNGVRDSRPQLAHIQLFHPDDIARFAQLGAIANFQPLWAYADDYITELTQPRLGPERSRWLYPIASVLAAQAQVASGSDWPVSSANPLEGIEIGVTRRALGDSTRAAWIEQERVSLLAMIRSYTLGAAYANFEESVSGSIEVGKWADLIVLDRDIFELAEHEIHTAQVVRTLLEGRTIWQAEP